MRHKHTALNAFYAALAVMNRPRIWVPLLLYLGIELGTIAFYRATFLGPLSRLWGLLAPADIRAALTHYPNDLVHMPLLLRRFGFGLDVVVGVVLRAATVVLFVNALRDKPLELGEAFRLSFSRYRALVQVALASALVLLVATQLPAVIGRMKTLPAAPKLALLTSAVVHIVVWAVFVYAVPFVVLMGYSVRKAIGSSATWTLHSFSQTVLLVLLPLLFEVPTIVLGLESKTLVSSIGPEAMIGLAVAAAITNWCATMLLCGGLSVWFIRAKRNELAI